MEINDIQSRSRETLVDTGPGGSEPGITRIMTWVFKNPDVKDKTLIINL